MGDRTTPRTADDDVASAVTDPMIGHRQEQLGSGGSQEPPVRLLPALRRELAAGRLPGRR